MPLTNRPRILITCWRRPLPTYLGVRTVLDTLDPAYATRVADAGGLPVVSSRPPAAGAEWVDDVLSLADGVLLSGGGDVAPSSYGAAPENVEGADEDADAWELAILRRARERRLPTLAICRGAQLLAVAHGGRLAQRVSARSGHRELDGLEPEEILSARHRVEVAPGSRLSLALGDQRIVVNTIHHHEIIDAGELEVSATADGVIEAVEPRLEWACIGVQWHPEKMDEPEQRGLFTQLVDAARERGHSRASEAAA
jgi:putative glutamine amidotransferase